MNRDPARLTPPALSERARTILAVGLLLAASATSAISSGVPARSPVATADAKSFGAKGDGKADDSDAIQACLDAVAPLPGSNWGGECHLPGGAYYISKSLQISNFTTFSGEGPGTVIDNQTVPLNAPQLTNKDPRSAIDISIRDLNFRGGNYGLEFQVRDEVAYIHISNVIFGLQTVANIATNQGFEVSSFDNVEWDDAPQGIVSPFPTNGNTWIGGVSQKHSGPHLNFGPSVANSFLGTVFQGGGVAGRSTIKLISPKNFSLRGIYAEGTHTYFLTETGSNGTTTIEDSHFTGANVGAGFTPYKWSSDGAIEFGANDWLERSDGPARLTIRGFNGDKLGGNNQTTFVSSRVRKDVVSSDLTVASPRVTLVDISRVLHSRDDASLQNLTGTLTVEYIGVDRSGVTTTFSREYLVNVYAPRGGPMAAMVTQLGDASTSRGGVLTVTVFGAPTHTNLDIGAVLSHAPVLGVDSARAAQLKVEFDYIASSTDVADYMTSKLAF